MSDSNYNDQEDLDEEFKAFAAQVAADEEARKNRGGFTPFEFEKIKWTGLEKAVAGVRKTKILRALGGTPNSNKTPFCSRTVRIASIVGDDKKQRRYILPSFEENKGHIIWRIINHVLAITWTPDKKKVFTHETTHPEIFQMVKNNSFPVGTIRQKSDKGWGGRDMFITNCIDRAQMAWHRENKHSMLLSKEIRLWANPKDGTILEFPEQGIPSYGFVQMVASELFAYYGNWSNYDIGVERTGTMNAPYKIFNCDKNPEKVPENVRKFIISGPLTDEELSWEMYDISKLFGVSSYTKWWNNLKNSIAKIDTDTGTHFYAELKSLMEAEKKERAAARAAGAAAEAEEEEEAAQETPAPSEATPATVREAAPIVQADKSDCIDQLPQNLKDQIESFSYDSRGNLVIKYKGNESTVGCPKCKTASPKSWTQCPKCGLVF